MFRRLLAVAVLVSLAAAPVHAQGRQSGALSGRLTSAESTYLASIRPSASAPADQLVNHAWILGGTARIPWATQVGVDALLDWVP